MDRGSTRRGAHVVIVGAILVLAACGEDRSTSLESVPPPDDAAATGADGRGAGASADAAQRLAGDDGWLFLGDSITVMSLGEPAALEAEVRTLDPSRAPSVEQRAEGGTTTNDILETIDDELASFDGSFVVLGYGTNDYPPNFSMRAVAEKVLDADKVPLIPTVPWSSDPGQNEQGREINERIEQLYCLPGVLPGADLYSTFEDRPDLLEDAVHPNERGRATWRSAWSGVMVSVDPLGDNDALRPECPTGIRWPIDQSTLRTAERRN